MKYVESNNVELKEQLSDSFLKTVCAFANENGGEIIFGVKDNGKQLGLKNFESTYPVIERKIIDCISPIPYFSIEIDHVTKIIKLLIEAGDEKPYFYKQKTYIRRNTSTVLADAAAQKKMIMESKNISFEEISINNPPLSFNTLEAMAKEKIGIKKPSADFLKTCGLINSDGKFNNAALLFSDDNSFRGIDTVKYDEQTGKFTFRKNISNCSILDQVKKATEVFEDIYSFEKIEGMNRNRYYEVPLSAFRETLVNAVIHRDWQLNSNIKITFFDDRVEVLSPGTLPKDINKNEFLNGFVSVPRNYIICSMFRKLGYIERMGYGISLIKKAYRQNILKPRFEISQNFIKVILPVISDAISMNEDMQKIMKVLKYSKGLSSTQISKLTKISRTKVVAVCNAMLDQGYIQKEGSGRATYYHL